MNWRDRIHRAFAAAGHDPDPDVVEELAQHAASAYAQARADSGTADAAERLVDAEIARWIEQAPALRRRSSRSAPVQSPAAGAGPVRGPSERRAVCLPSVEKAARRHGADGAHDGARDRCDDRPLQRRVRRAAEAAAVAGSPIGSCD